MKKLKAAYYRLRAGFGFNKGPSEWGAFPLEPYSHTPLDMPAQQPGMTGQVKEDILTRAAELGITAKDGRLRFDPALLDRAEFFTEATVFKYIDVNNDARELSLESASLAFTVCQVPVVYRLSQDNKVTIYTRDGGTASAACLELSEEHSQSLFTREGRIDRIVVAFAEDRMV